ESETAFIKFVPSKPVSGLSFELINDAPAPEVPWDEDAYDEWFWTPGEDDGGRTFHSHFRITAYDYPGQEWDKYVMITFNELNEIPWIWFNEPYPAISASVIRNCGDDDEEPTFDTSVWVEDDDRIWEDGQSRNQKLQVSVAPESDIQADVDPSDMQVGPF